MVFVGVAGCSSAPLASHVQHDSGLACRLRELGVYICIYIYMLYIFHTHIYTPIYIYIYKYFVALLILDISICLYIYIYIFFSTSTDSTDMVPIYMLYRCKLPCQVPFSKSLALYRKT